jgi:hypothetical protein
MILGAGLVLGGLGLGRADARRTAGDLDARFARESSRIDAVLARLDRPAEPVVCACAPSPGASESPAALPAVVRDAVREELGQAGFGPPARVERTADNDDAFASASAVVDEALGAGEWQPSYGARLRDLAAKLTPEDSANLHGSLARAVNQGKLVPPRGPFF